MKKRRMISVLTVILVFIGLLLFQVANWVPEAFGDIPFEQVLFHIMVPMDGADSAVLDSFVSECLPIPIIVSCILLLLLIISDWKTSVDIKNGQLQHKTNCILTVISSICCLIVYVFGITDCIYAVGIDQYWYNVMHPSNIYEKYYVDPSSVNYTFPETKRNLVYIFMESMETTYEDTAHGGYFEESLIPELTELSENNLTFTNGDYSNNGFYAPAMSGWTAAALVGQTSGVPLNTPAGANSYLSDKSFLPGAYTLGEAIFGDLVSPPVAVALGYKFTPLFAVRAEASGWQAKGGWVNPAITYKYKYLQGGLDAMFDLSNLCYGFHSKRIFNAYLFLGIGLNGAFDNDEAVALNASGYNLQRLWTGKKLYASGRIGLGTNLRLNDHVAINFELNTNMLSDKFNSKKGVNADWQFNGLVGFSFTLGKSSRKVAPVSYEPEQPVSVTTVEQRPEPTPVVEQSKPKEDKIVVEPMKQNIFFALNSARIQDEQQQKISSLVEYLEKNPTAKICITGYADVNTGNATINFKLSEARAKNVAEALKSKGIAADRIKVDFKGDTVQPYSTPKENRVSICITE